MSARAAPAAVAAATCADFDELALGTEYHVGDMFSNDGLDFAVRNIVQPDGTVGPSNYTKVVNTNNAGGSGQELNINNTNLEVVLAAPVAGITLKAGEYGGYVNLMVNGDLRKANDLTDFDGLVIGGALVEVGNPSPNLYKVRVSDGVSSFSIGGQEFFVDDVCVHPEPDEDNPGDLPVAPDLGDAPDSSNHHAMTNKAYPTVDGHFPTVWDDPTGDPSGPRHSNATREAILGNFMSREAEADQGPDGDGVNNILDGGVDVANLDRYDDGWRNRNVPIADCRSTTLRVRVSKSATATLEKMALNVWFDGNRDGDWEDVKKCETEDGTFEAYEWIVQNFVVDLTAIPAGGFVDIDVPTLPVLVGDGNDAPGAPGARPPWMRFTLSEAPAPRNPATGLADGRGPQHPDQYQWGETEDVRYRPLHQGQNPGQLTVEKTVSTPGPVQPGEVFSYTIRIKNAGGDGPTLAEMKDELPRGVMLAGRVAVSATMGDAAPFGYAFGDGSVRWRGALSPNSELTFEIPVRAALCFGGDVKTIRNTVRVRPGSGDGSEAYVDVSVQCRTLTIDDFDITAEVVDGSDVAAATDTPNEQGWQPGQPISVKFTITNTGDAAGHLALSLNYEESEAAGAVDAATMRLRRFRGPIVVVDPGATATRFLTIGNVESWYGCITCTVSAADVNGVDTVEPFPDGEQALNIEAEICLVDAGEGRCPDDAGAERVRRIPLVVRWFTQDLGDAPDSSNHWGAGMTAYTGVPANYPTVFDPATGAEQGPRHYNPRPFHLGPLVSWEGEADLGPDADGVHNLRPPLNQANLDRFDDGVNPPAWTLQNCRVTEVPVQVFISPALAAYFAQNQQQGYVNIWLDANRDGDWADGVECPTADNQPTGPALEHVVIDFRVDVAALGPGLHTIRVTTGRVPWPAEPATQPAWVRVTLSERESNKPLSDFGVKHGDGRGYDKPFRFGETEDYLWRPADQPGGVDVAVTKRGKAFQIRDEESGEVVTRIAWSIEYRNRGDLPAENVVLRDQLEDGQNIIAILIGLFAPEGVTRSDDGDTLVFNIGTLPPGAGGRIVLTTKTVDDVASLKNKATVRADGDVDESNNVATAEVTLGLHAPRILSPISGATCSGEITVVGHAAPNATVELHVSDGTSNTILVGEDGRWSADLTLPDGEYTLWAIATKGDKTSEPSAVVELTVDSTLAWSPISLTFTDARGHVRHPVDPDGFLEPDGWTLQLRPNTTYTVSVLVCCDSENVKVTLAGVADDPVELTDADGDGTFTAVFTTGARDPDPTGITLTVLCGDAEVSSSGEVVLIDPAGTVYDIGSGQPLAAAAVACMEEQVSTASGEAVFSLWDAAAYGQTNPQSTGADGYFSFLTPAGSYQLDVSASGYQPYRSPSLAVVSDPVYYDVPLTPVVDEAATVRIEITEVGFSPAVATVKPGDIIEWVNTDTTAHSATRLAGVGAAAIAADETWDSGALQPGESYKVQVDAAGTYTYADRLNTANEGAVMVVSGGTTLLLPRLGR